MAENLDQRPALGTRYRPCDPVRSAVRSQLAEGKGQAAGGVAGRPLVRPDGEGGDAVRLLEFRPASDYPGPGPPRAVKRP